MPRSFDHGAFYQDLIRHKLLSAYREQKHLPVTLCYIRTISGSLARLFSLVSTCLLDSTRSSNIHFGKTLLDVLREHDVSPLFIVVYL